MQPSLAAMINEHIDRARLPDIEKPKVADGDDEKKKKKKRHGGPDKKPVPGSKKRKKKVDWKNAGRVQIRLFHPNPDVLPEAWAQLRSELELLPMVMKPGSEHFDEDMQTELALTRAAMEQGWRANQVAEQARRFAGSRTVTELSDGTLASVGTQNEKA